MAGELKRITKLATSSMVITPQLMRWLTQHPEGVVVETVEDAQLLLELAKSQGSRSRAFHASALMGCPRKQLYDFTDDTPSMNRARLQNIFNDGTWRHMRWQLMLMKAGLLEAVEVPVRLPEHNLTGHMDGEGLDEGGDRWMFELKGTSKSLSAIERDGAMPQHIEQVSVYLWATGIPKAVIVYENKASQEWSEVVVHLDPSTSDRIEAKLKLLNAHLERDTKPPMLEPCARGDFSDAYGHDCRWAAQCSAEGGGVTHDLD